MKPPTLQALSSVPLNNREVWAYLRISLTRGEQPNSLAVQREQITRWCATEGYTLRGVTEDEDSSATEIAFFDRPRVQAMLSEMPDACRCLVATKLDRLFRKTTDGLLAMQELLALGFRTKIFDTPADTSTAAGELALTALLMVGRYETRRRKERMAETCVSMRQNRHRTGAIPYGWDAVPSTRISKTERRADDLVVNVAEQRILRLILKWHGEGISDHVISRKLRLMGKKTKTGKPLWYAVTVKSVREHALLDEQPEARIAA